MTTTEPFSAPAALPDPDAPVVDRNGVRRSKDGRPYVKVPCVNRQPLVIRIAGESEEERRREVWAADPESCIEGRIAGKRAGTTKKCPKCDGLTGRKEVLYTRCTTFVGALEDRANLEAWQKRIVILGLKASGLLRERLAVTDIDDREALDQIAEEAYEAGDGYRAAQKGTDLHELTERVDQGLGLPDDVSLADRADMAAWCRLLDEYGVTVLDLETFVVEDEFKIAGTYDRRGVSADPRMLCPICDDPDTCSYRPKILDLKTGRVDYGGGKMCQQLAVYSRGKRYDPETGERDEHDVCPHLGFIVHLPQGTGEATMHSLDLTKGWEAVGLSSLVRKHRSESKRWVVALAPAAIEFVP